MSKIQLILVLVMLYCIKTFAQCDSGIVLKGTQIVMPKKTYNCIANTVNKQNEALNLADSLIDAQRQAISAINAKVKFQETVIDFMEQTIKNQRFNYAKADSIHAHIQTELEQEITKLKQKKKHTIWYYIASALGGFLIGKAL